VDVWSLEATKRGCVIEDALALTDYKGWTRSSEFELKTKDGKWRKPGKEEAKYFPRVDFHHPKTDDVVSLKTMDPHGPRWEYDLQQYIESHSPNGEVTITSKGKTWPAKLKLDIRVPKGFGKKVQKAADTMLAQVRKSGAGKYLQVEVKEYP
jgi:hypothetical protein